MNKTLFIILLIVIGACIAIYTGFRLLNRKHPYTIGVNKITYDTTRKELVERKKALMLKEYDSVFTVIGRETTIIYYLRAWTLTLLALWLTTFLPREKSNLKFMYYSGLLIIVVFYAFEISERIVIITLIQRLRDLEIIFSLDDTNAFSTAVINYQFRDIHDESSSLLNSNLFKAIGDPKVYTWSFFLYIIYYTAIKEYLRRAK